MLRRRMYVINRVLLILTFLSIFIASTILAYIQGYYFKLSYAPTAITSLIGLLMSVQLIFVDNLELKFDWNIKKAEFTTVAISSACVLVLATTLGILQDYFALATVLLWIIPCILLFYRLTKKEKLERIDGTSKISLMDIDNSISFDMEARRSGIQPPYDLSTSKGRCKCCFVWFLVLFIIAISITMSVIAAISSYYYHEFEPVGEIVSVRAYPASKPQNKQEINMRLNCYGTREENKHILVFQHGGGSNGLAFTAIQDFLSEADIRSCTYDRAGYGRSEGGPNNDSPKDVVQRLYQLLQKSGEKGPYVLVGWSAGVEIIQTFQYHHQNQVQGLVFIDGYSDYRHLEAIDRNLTQAYIDSTTKSLVSLLDFLRWTEPLGLGLLVGKFSNYKPDSMEDYYTAYYRNYMFWNSQYIDVSKKQQFTSYLTQLGQITQSSQPYNSSIPLNWPNIKIPLLILASNNTIDNQNPANIYYKQCLKYMEKSLKSTLEIINAEHDMVYTQPYDIYIKLKQFSDSIHNSK